MWSFKVQGLWGNCQIRKRNADAHTIEPLLFHFGNLFFCFTLFSRLCQWPCTTFLAFHAFSLLILNAYLLHCFSPFLIHVQTMAKRPHACWCYFETPHLLCILTNHNTYTITWGMNDIIPIGYEVGEGEEIAIFLSCDIWQVLAGRRLPTHAQWWSTWSRPDTFILLWTFK